MIQLLAYTNNPGEIIPLQAAQIKLLRRYEEKEYAFVASDLKLELVNALEIYNRLTSGEEITVLVKKEETIFFRGYLQREGTSWNPEKQIFSITAIHIGKKIFQILEQQKYYAHVYNPDYSLELNFQEWVNFNVGTIGIDLEKYTMRQRIIDFAKYSNSVGYVKNNLSPFSYLSPVVAIEKRGGQTITADDSMLFQYEEEQQNANYNAVLFPANIVVETELFPTLLFYHNNNINACILQQDEEIFKKIGVPYTIVQLNDEIIIPENTLDMRVPADAYTKTHTFAFTTRPVIFHYKNNQWVNNPLNYAQQNYGAFVNPYRKLTLGFRQIIQAQPCQKLVAMGLNLYITEIEDDLVNQTSTVKGNLF